MESWQQYISEKKSYKKNEKGGKTSKKEISAMKRKAADKIISDLAKEKNKEEKTKEKSAYQSYLDKQLEFKKQKYEDQKKRQLEKIREKGKAESEQQKAKAKQALSDIKVSRISSKDKDPTAHTKAIEGIGSLAFGLTKAAYHGAKALKKKKDAERAEKEAAARQAEMKGKGSPGRPKGESKAETAKVDKKSEGSRKAISGTPERKRLVPSTKRLPPASKKIAPSGGTPYQAPPSPSRETGMTLGQRARRNPALKSALIKTRMEEYSNWREEFLFEVEESSKKTGKKKVIDIMKGKNKVTINPLEEDHKEVASGEKKDDEGYMANVELDQIERAVKALRKKVKKSDTQLPAWVQSKITRAADYIDTASSYLQSDVKEELLGEAPLRDEPLWDMSGDRKNKPVVPSVRDQIAKSNQIIKGGRVAALNAKNDTVQTTQLANRRMPGNEKPGMSGPPTPGTSTAPRVPTKVTPAKPGTSSSATASTAQKIQGGMKVYAAQRKAGDMKGAAETGMAVNKLKYGDNFAKPKTPNPLMRDMPGQNKAELDQIRGNAAVNSISQSPSAKNILSGTAKSATANQIGKASLDRSAAAVEAKPPATPAPGSVPNPPAPKVATPAPGSVPNPPKPKQQLTQSIHYPEMMDVLNEIKGGLWEGKKSEMPCNKPKAQAHGSGETGKSHVVKACEGGKEKLIRFGQLGVKGSPKKEGESEAYASRRHRFQTRHAKNIARGKMSAAYWANKVKW